MEIDEYDLKNLKHELKEWSEMTDNMCELLNELFKYPKPSKEMTERIQALVKEYQWDNGHLSSYVVPEIDCVH